MSKPPAPHLTAPPDNASATLGRSVRALVMRNIASRAIAMAGGLALAGLFGPATFGVYAVLVALLAVLNVFTSAGTTAAILRRPEEPRAIELRALFTFQLAVGLAIFGVAVLAAFIIAPSFGATSDGAQAGALLMAALPISAFRIVPACLLERDLRYGRLAFIDLAEQATFYATAVGFALAGAGIWSVAPAGAASAGVAAIVAATLSVTHHRPTFHVSALLPLWRFAVKFQLAHVLAVARDFGLSALLLAFAGSQITGVWALAQRLLVPLLTLFQAFWRVGFVGFARIRDRAQASRQAQLLLNTSALAAAATMAVIVGTTSAVIDALLGEEWSGAFVPLVIAAVGWLVAGPVSSAVLGLIQARGDMRVPTGILGFQIAVLWVAAIVVAPHAGATAIGAAWLAALVVEGGVLLLFSSRYVQLRLEVPAAAATIGFVGALAGWSVAVMLPNLLGVLLAGATALGVWTACSWAILRVELRQLVAFAGASPPPTGLGAS